MLSFWFAKKNADQNGRSINNNMYFYKILIKLYRMFCLSLYGDNLAMINADAENVDMAEVRLDLCDLKNLDAVLNVFESKCITIATCRPNVMCLDEKVALLKKAIDKGASYIDVEYEMPRLASDELIHYAKDKNCKVIISYHNYDSTPTKPYLYSIIEKSKKNGADIVKIACMAENECDITSLLSLNTVSSDIVSFAMGELGSGSRIICLDRGAPFTYVAANTLSKTAPGQLTIDEIEQILKA